MFSFDAWEQACDVSQNPFVPAEFFNVYIKAFIRYLLKYDSVSMEGGILNLVKAYYGCVEAQNRGTLRVHMVVWVHGALNPMDIKNQIMSMGDEQFERRLILFLDDTISNNIPGNPDPAVIVSSAQFKPATVRGPDPDGVDYDVRRRRDLHFLVPDCQAHFHTSSCYKYSKTECRYKLDPKCTVPRMFFDHITGELTYRISNGMINNYNSTLLTALRCNMDIKFVGSGNIVQAIVYYITDYLTKVDLKTYAAYTTLEMAVSKLVQRPDIEDDMACTIRCLLVKCSNVLISKQELSAQQVASHLLDFEDHFTSHLFRPFYWKSFEIYVEKQESSSSETSDIVDIADVDVDLDEAGMLNGEPLDAVTISRVVHGHVLCKANLGMDYIYRPIALSSMTLWDFIVGTIKVGVSRKEKQDTLCVLS